MSGLNSVLPFALTSVHLRQGTVPLETPTHRLRAKSSTDRAGLGALRHVTIHHTIFERVVCSRQPALPTGNFRLSELSLTRPRIAYILGNIIKLLSNNDGDYAY